MLTYFHHGAQSFSDRGNWDDYPVKMPTFSEYLNMVSMFQGNIYRIAHAQMSWRICSGAVEQPLYAFSMSKMNL